MADELGSGVRNLMKYVRIYSKRSPQLIEEDIFKIIIPLNEQVTEQASREKTIITFCQEEKSVKEIMQHLGLTHREYFRSEILNPLLTKGLLRLTIPDKPNSPKQKYIVVKNQKGQTRLKRTTLS